MSQLTMADLAKFTGTSQWFRHALVRNVLYTEGIQFLAEKANAYWLLDKIATLQLDPKIKAEPFQVWKLEVAHNIGALTCSDGGKPEQGGAARLLHVEEIAYTDFPLGHIEIWVEDGVILLPSEH